MRPSRVAVLLGLLPVLAVAPAARAAFPGVNGRIAFALTGQPAGPPATGLITMAPDGGDGAAVGRGALPDWSPDGRRLLLVVRGSGRSLLFVQAADGSLRRRVRLPTLGRYTRGPGAPRWSADGRHILFLAYTLGIEPRSALFRVRADGRDPRLIRRFASNTDAAFAPGPDGRLVAFTQYVRSARAFGVFTMPAAGGHARLLTTLGAAGAPPTRLDWSPDGTRIALDGDGIVVAQADGSGRVTLAADGREPAFSPDGNELAFVHFTDQRSEGSYPTAIDVIDADGSARRPVTTDARGVAWPTWQPVPAG